MHWVFFLVVAVLPATEPPEVLGREHFDTIHWFLWARGEGTKWEWVNIGIYATQEDCNREREELMGYGLDLDCAPIIPLAA